MDNTTLIALAGIITTFSASIIANLHSARMLRTELDNQFKQKQFELYYSEKLKIFGEFTSKAPLLPTDKDSLEKYDMYYASALKVALLCDTEPQKLINALLTFTNTALLNGMKVDRAWEVSYLEQVSKITFLLNEELKSTSNLIPPKHKWHTRWHKQDQ